MPTAYVYVYLEEGPVPAGILETSRHGPRGGKARFRYGRRYLQHAKTGWRLIPFQLPLTAPDADRDYITEEGFALFNGIRDAAPDGWGRHLMERAAGARALSEFDYLVATGDSQVLERWHSAQTCPGRVASSHGKRKRWTARNPRFGRDD